MSFSSSAPAAPAPPPPASATSVQDDDSLRSLLQLALPKPTHIAASDGGGAVLALALHCLMVREGFTTVLEEGQAEARGRCSSFAPPPGWAGRFKDEWVFLYAKDGFASRFILHCSLQAASKRMLVSVAEETNSVNNEHLLGLQLDNYVPDVSRLRSNDWRGVVVRAHNMSDLFQKHITVPLLAHAEELSSCAAVEDESSGGPLRSNRTSTSSLYGWLAGEMEGEAALVRVRYVTAVAVAAGALGLAAVWALYASRPSAHDGGGSRGGGGGSTASGGRSAAMAGSSGGRLASSRY